MGNSSFNWLEDADGLARAFPQARIMLYDYASAWIGALKVRATMRSICLWLLEDLNAKRKVGFHTSTSGLSVYSPCARLAPRLLGRWYSSVIAWAAWSLQRSVWKTGSSCDNSDIT